MWLLLIEGIKPVLCAFLMFMTLLCGLVVLLLAFALYHNSNKKNFAAAILVLSILATLLILSIHCMTELRIAPLFVIFLVMGFIGGYSGYVYGLVEAR